ncbi:hypothetical protein [Tenacibaculum sp. 1_MG-2023]|nr:hypothetical protein [Tenacibaculum sp. 1_MG-2023]MDO6598509.1 hypothetical protein [Tenacibaculum sp. 1_MG-2023]
MNNKNQTTYSTIIGTSTSHYHKKPTILRKVVNWIYNFIEKAE